MTGMDVLWTLKAPMEAQDDQSDSGERSSRKRSLMKPPALLVSMGFVKPRVWWEAFKAVYGYRQSPRLWGDHRDVTLRKKKIRLESGWLVLRQMVSEPSMWLIVEEQDSGHEAIRGLMLVYVDDLLICGDEEAIERMTDCIQQTWEVSTPEKIGGEKGVRFLGMELWRKDGVWKATQVAYTLDLLRRHLGESQEVWPVRKIPAAKDVEEVTEVEKTPKDVKEAQKIVGELVWLSTRCRPDIIYIVAKLASGISRWPKAVQSLAKQVWQYLAGTVHQGLIFDVAAEENSLNVFADASFGDQCQGCTLVQWGGAPILWRSSRQALVSSSTAEAELIELLESVNSGEAVRVVIEEITNRECLAKAFSDSTSALAIAVGESGSSKTRHLRRRAQSLRWGVSRGDWVARHVPGVENPADLGTKALASEKFEKFKGQIGMGLVLVVTEEVQEPKGEEEGEEGEKLRYQDSRDAQLRKVLAVVVMAAHLSVAKGEDGEEEQSVTLLDFVVFWLVLPGIVVLLFILWRQKNSAQQKLKDKEEEEKKLEVEKKLEEKIQRQVAESVKKLREAEREEERARSSSYGGSEGLSRRLRRNQSEESGASSVSRITHVSEPRTEVVGRAADEASASSEGRVGCSVASCPQLSFPEDAADLYISPGGSKYHFHRQCRGLRNATDVSVVPRCKNCGPVQVRPRCALFGRHGSEMHTIRGHAAVLGEYSHFEPCRICTGA